MLEQSVDTLKGIGQAKKTALEKMQLFTLKDLLFFFPRDYQDFSVCSKVENAQHGELVALRLTVLKEPALVRPSRSLEMVTASADDDTGKIQIVWFNQPYRKKQISAGDNKIFCGKVDATRGLRLVNPMVIETLPGILPVYSTTQGITQKNLRDAVAQAIKVGLNEAEDAMPAAFRKQYALCELQAALFGIHFPQSEEELKEAKYRLAFEDMLYYLLALALLKREREQRPGISFEISDIFERFISSLPFAPTDAQARVMKEIAADMNKKQPMNRLVQGDVGSGKTILAMFALQVAVENGYQAAFMAPTEILARQHYELLRARYGSKACLLLGGMKKSERNETYAQIESGGAKYIVGTHALLQSELSFYNLGLVVTDEQHRFGVRQRALLVNKSGVQPDALIMSATPIPRTLSMLLYGDLDLSVVDELPPGRQDVVTRVVPQKKRDDMYDFIKKQAQLGRQAYVVCPLVEQSELLLGARSVQEIYEELKNMMPSLRIALLHGRMAGAKKEETVEAFRKRELDVLVSTTVIEVGVDVPNATVMVIESADRFGLAQLHQLRGRVGRGGELSYCFLLSEAQSQTANARLETMVQTNNGFEIAQKDLELRGPGEFLGTRQHGVDTFQAAKMASNMDVLLSAQLAADRLIEQNDAKEYEAMFEKARHIYKTRMQNIANN